MATRTITYKVCDGCGRSDMIGVYLAVEIVLTQTITQFCGPTKTVDICASCVDADKYICRLCAAVHSDLHPCDAQLRAIEDANQ